jgi:hypothetical protein
VIPRYFFSAASCGADLGGVQLAPLLGFLGRRGLGVAGRAQRVVVAERLRLLGRRGLLRAERRVADFGRLATLDRSGTSVPKRLSAR